MILDLPSLLVIAGIFCVMMLAGTVKGSLGIGFPAVAMSILPIFIEPAFAVTLLAIPVFVTNATQFLSIKGWPALVRRFLIAGTCIIVTTFVVVQFLAEVPSRWINIAVGVSLCVFSFASLFRVELHVNDGPVWQVLVGITSGLFGGISAVKAPVMIYSVALNLPRDQFMGVAGFLFFCGGVGLVSGSISANMLNGVTFTLSVLATLASLIGFRVGAVIRARLTDRMFRLILLWMILALGLRLILVNLF